MDNPFPPANQPEEHVDHAIEAVLLEPVPHESLERSMAAALSWETTRTSRISPPRSWRRAAVVAAASVILALGALMFFRLSERPEASDSHSTAMNPSVHERMTFFAPGPMIGASVADIAPILITNGPELPVRLGEKVAYKDVGKALGVDQSRLHVWDWTKSDLSRVMIVKKDYRGSTLSPDGKLLLSATGKAVEVPTGQTREFQGFRVEDGQRLSRIWYSSSGRHVVALIHVRSEKQRVQFLPPLYSMQHWWALRVIELETGKVVDEFPAAGLPAAIISPDETSIIYSSAENGVIRQELKSRKILTQYQPTFGNRAVVGIAMSRDGRHIAASHYDGELFIWETLSGKQVMHHRFLRNDGEHDRFFQAQLLWFSPDDQLLAMASGSRLKILDPRTGKIVAQHYHETTPAFVHLRWSQDGQRVILVAPATIAEIAPESGFPPRATADRMPQIYEWEWKTGALKPRVYPAVDQ